MSDELRDEFRKIIWDCTDNDGATMDYEMDHVGMPWLRQKILEARIEEAARSTHQGDWDGEGDYVCPICKRILELNRELEALKCPTTSGKTS